MCGRPPYYFPIGDVARVAEQPQRVKWQDAGTGGHSNDFAPSFPQRAHFQTLLAHGKAAMFRVGGQ